LELLATLDVPGHPGKRIELLHGDLTALAPHEAIDLLIVSAFPDDYMPTHGSLIGALHRKGVSVAGLASRKEVDLRKDFSCWLSQPLPTSAHGFRRILCFEPLVRGSPPTVVGDIFRALTPILGERPEIRSAAMPIVASGDQGWSVAEMLEPLLDAALHWMQHGLPLDVLKVVAYSDAQAVAAEADFKTWASRYSFAPPPAVEVSADFDVFISYARENASEVDRFEQMLLRKHPMIRIFLDRKSINVGMAWQPEIFESLDRCRKVVAMFSPDYLQSKVCKEEFNIAWVRSRESEQEVIFPVYLFSVNLPTYMKYRSYVDCREGDAAKLQAACDALCNLL
jgi:hypothetical protein